MVADFQVGDAFAEFFHDARELVAHGDGGILTRDGVRVPVLGAEDGAVEVFVQVGAANAAPGDLNEYFTGGYFGGRDVFDTNIVAVIETSCLHGRLLNLGRWPL